MNGMVGKENRMSQSNIMDRSALGKAVDGRSDDEINQALAGKYDQTCAEVFEGMKKHFLPERAGDQKAVIQYNVTAPDAVTHTPSSTKSLPTANRFRRTACNRFSRNCGTSRSIANTRR